MTSEPPVFSWWLGECIAEVRFVELVSCPIILQNVSPAPRTPRQGYSAMRQSVKMFAISVVDDHYSWISLPCLWHRCPG